jgi:hypothetical protein
MKVVSAVDAVWQAIELLPADAQADVRESLRRYVDALLASYNESNVDVSPLLANPTVTRARAEVWDRSAAACNEPGGDKARGMLLPALSTMFGAVDSERLARRIHQPLLIFVMLAMTAFVAALFGGFRLSNAPTRNWVYNLGNATTVSAAVWVIINLEYPRLGVIGIRNIDRALAELRATM